MIPVRLSFFCVMLAYSNLIPLPALRVIFLDFSLKQTSSFRLCETGCTVMSPFRLSIPCLR